MMAFFYVKSDDTPAIPVRRPKRGSLAGISLNKVAELWFVVAVLGQWIFMYYAAIAYGKPAFQGNLEDWNKVMPHGYQAGDTLGNLAVGAHVLLAIIIMLCGPLQLVPQIQRHLPRFHRWNGRIYLLAVVTTSLAGLYMIWTRGTAGGLVQQIGISLDAVLILLFAGLALRTAMARRFKAHRQWALRLFIASSAVWFYRIMFMLWMFIHDGRSVGFEPKTFEGPFTYSMAFIHYLLPLLLLELYFFSQERAGTKGKIAMAVGLLICTAAMGLGIIMAAIGMWLPRL